MESVRSSVPTWVKRIVWNWKHEGVAIDPLASPLVDFLGPRIPKGASLLDLGCAGGNLRAGLRQQGWTGEYVGVDISAKAISVARTVNDPRATWVVSPIEDFEIDRDFDVICLVESVYYIRLDRVKAVLGRCRKRGKTTYLRIWDRKTHAPFIREMGQHVNPQPDVFVLA